MTKKVKSKKKDTRAPKGTKSSVQESLQFPLDKHNYILMAIGFLSIVIGFILMSGTENIYSFRKITLSVIFIIFGFVFEIFAIMKKPRD